jgi:hypothetical protein
MKGYFVLGGSRGIPPDLPTFDTRVSYVGNHTKSKERGKFVICSDLDQMTINMPSRDKQIILWSSKDDHKFFSSMQNLDSEFGINYRSKLLSMVDLLSPDFYGAVNNINVSTHGSIALLGSSISYFGIQDTQSGASYLMWGTDEDLRALQISSPLRYLIYRFPKTKAVFLPGESICSKWWRWVSNFSTLHAFNALEMRLTNGPTG